MTREGRFPSCSHTHTHPHSGLRSVHRADLLGVRWPHTVPSGGLRGRPLTFFKASFIHQLVVSTRGHHLGKGVSGPAGSVLF